MVNLVIVSHSARLGEGVGELARQMLINDGCKLAIAAGIDDPDSPIGTDPLKVMEAIESVADTDHSRPLDWYRPRRLHRTGCRAAILYAER